MKDKGIDQGEQRGKRREIGGLRGAPEERQARCRKQGGETDERLKEGDEMSAN